MTTTTTATAARGGAWLLDETGAATVFTPEKMTDEHRLMAQMTDEFVTNEILAQLEELENKNWDVARRLVKRCGELGLLGVNVPEAYGGVNLDKVSSMIVAEHIASSASFGATFGGCANLCILPIFLFGTPEQKQKYLPRLVTGEFVGAYALSESGSGSDALAARTRATKHADGSWVLSGEKMWITNGGFADVIIVFAKVDGEHFTAFIVERGFPGVSSGKEEHKMGLHGSSTTPILLQDVKVPAENVLGEVGKGHKVALNTRNYGRFKLGAMCAGGCKAAIGEAARYAKQRKQFGQPIASFGAIKHKLGEMTARTYAIESLLYRTAGLIDATLTATPHDPDDGAAVARAVEEFAVEASIAKVAVSEVLDFVLDENVQIHGGNGFVRDYSAERYYRDARVNRIFEGTNEINRMLIPGMLITSCCRPPLRAPASAPAIGSRTKPGRWPSSRRWG
jgi:alkylation response protein AidB-like acyl-CoA dehydrogenase